jgi:hypothetical protein
MFPQLGGYHVSGPKTTIEQSNVHVCQYVRKDPCIATTVIIAVVVNEG